MNSSGIVGAWPPPDGVIPNFNNPQSIASRVIVAALVSPGVAVLFVLMRSYTKIVVFRRFDLDDYSVIVAFLFALAFSVLQVIQTYHGSGRHIWDVPLDDYLLYTKLGIVGAVTYNLSTLFTKVAILLLYLRLSTDTYFRSVACLVMFVAVGYSLAGGFAFFYLCSPIRRYWDFSIPGSCVNFGAAFLAGAALNVATDMILLLLPIWLLQPLRLPIRQKIGVTMILMTGSFVCAVSIYRLALIPSGLNDVDGTWHYIRNLIWCIIEMYSGIICACLPSLKSFTKLHFSHLFNAPRPVLVRQSGYVQAVSRRDVAGSQSKTRGWFSGNFQMSTRKSITGSDSTMELGQHNALSNDTDVHCSELVAKVGV